VVGDHEYVVAPEAVSDTELPMQMLADDGVTVIVGTLLTVIVRIAVTLHPVVPVIVYVVVAVALHVTVAPVVALKPVDGNHV
jgi:hypothetical protein